MTQRSSFLPSINGDRFSSSKANSAANSPQKKLYAADVMWKNPSLKNLWKNIHRNKQMENLGEVPNKSELFLGYDTSTPEENEITARNREIYINDFVKNYVHKRELEFPRFKPQHNFRAKRMQGTQEWTIPKKKPKAITMPSLEFTEEVIRRRGDPTFSSYFSADIKKLYKMKDLSISVKRQRTNGKSFKSNSKRSQPRKHTLCMPEYKGKDVKLPSKSKSYFRRKENEENVLKNQVGKSTHLWEKHVLGLISKQTAQWIANQCSTGEQRGRLIGFLDEKYEIKDTEKDGTAMVNKILSINDDALTLPKKEKVSSLAVFESLHSEDLI